MSNNFKFVLNRAGVATLLKSEEMQEVLNGVAKEARDKCGDGYNQDIYVGKRRANAMIYPETQRAYYSNLKHNTLLKAIK